MSILITVKQYIINNRVKISYSIGAIIALVLLCKVGLIWLIVAGVWGLVHWLLIRKSSKQETVATVVDPTETVYED